MPEELSKTEVATPITDPEQVIQAAAETAKQNAERAKANADRAAREFGEKHPAAIAYRLALNAAEAERKVASATSGLVRLPQPGGPETLERSWQTLLNKSGYVTPERAAEIEAVQRRQEQASRALAASRLRESAGILKRYESADLDDLSFIEQAVPDALEDYRAARDALAELLTFPGTVVLRGDNGSGKTHLASALVRRCCELGRSARYTTAFDFFVELKSTFGEPGRTQADLIQRYRRYELLVIDEYEVRSDNSWENTVFRSLIDSRYGAMLSTVLVTNLTIEELQDYLPRAVRDRVRESGSLVECNWGSLRPFRRNLIEPQPTTPAPTEAPTSR